MERFLPARKLSYYKLKKIRERRYGITRKRKHSNTKSPKSTSIAPQKLTLMENGLKTKLLIMPNRNETRTASIFFYFKVGSKNELKSFRGISHFIEHMVFKGSPKYPSYLDISKTFDANGISFNAFTSKDMTAYHYKFLANENNMKLICSITSDMIFHPLMRDKEIATERNVIIQEMKDDEDDIDEWIGDKIESSVFAGHPLENSIIGNLETLNKIGRKELLEYHAQYYKPDNLVIAISGNIQSQYLNIINKYFSTSYDKHDKHISDKFKKISLDTQGISNLIPYVDKNAKLTIECFPKNLKQDYVFIVFKTRGAFDPLKNYYKLIANILGGNMSSRLFVRIREQLGLVYSIKCEMSNHEEVGYFAITTQNEPKTTIECLKNIFIELDKFKNKGILEKELMDNKKNYVDTFITNFDDIEYENEYFAKHILYNLPLETTQQRIDKINAFTTDEIINAAKELFNYSKMHILTFGKVKESQIKKIIVNFN